MKILTILLAITFSVMFSSSSFAEWTGAVIEKGGDTYYVDFERIRKHDEYLYWWNLRDYLKPTEHGDLSFKSYIQGDCKMFRFKILAMSLHIQPMGRGTPSVSSNEPEKEWSYPAPNTAIETILEYVCAYAK